MAANSTATPTPSVSPATERRPIGGMLHGPAFDIGFIAGTLLVGIVSASIVVVNPSLFKVVLFADIWLLGYHHVISTYSRLVVDSKSRREHRALLTWVPLAVVAAVVAIVYGIGVWALATTYLYWQWWHYTRQSWGVARVYQRKSTFVGNERLLKAAFYLLPLVGILYRSYQAPTEFLGGELRTVPVPGIVVAVMAVVAMGALVALVVEMVGGWRRGEVSSAYALYLASHFVIFAVGYILISSIDYGWLAINIWHNAQYIGFVWFFNSRRAGTDTNTSPTLFTRLSRPRNFGWYMLASVAVSTAAYQVIGATVATLVAPVIVYQVVNFHHYVVDSVIWKVRKKPLQTTLGIAA